MNRTRLHFIKAMLPGFIPLIIFMLADSFWGTKEGLIIAIILGILELLIIWFREKRLERFVLFDIGLIIFFAGISLLLNNDIFFKLKPAVMELILCVILGVSAFTPANIMQMMTLRYLKGIKMNDAALAKMRQSMIIMFFLFLAHTALIVFSAFCMSSAAWAFISGVMFYLIFAVYLGIEYILLKMKIKKQ